MARTKPKEEPTPMTTGKDGTPYTRVVTFANVQVARALLPYLHDTPRNDVKERLTDRIDEVGDAEAFDLDLTESEKSFLVVTVGPLRDAKDSLKQAMYRDVRNVRPIADPRPGVYAHYAQTEYEDSTSPAVIERLEKQAKVNAERHKVEMAKINAEVAQRSAMLEQNRRG